MANNMKKWTVLLLVLVCVFAFAACTDTNDPSTTASEGMEFVLNEDEKGYTLENIGTCKDEHIVIPETYNGLPVTAVGADAFGGTDIRSIYVPSSVAAFDVNAIWECLKLTEILVSEDNPYFTSIDGNMYSKDATSLLLYAPGKTDTEFTVPDGVTTIGSYAFGLAEHLQSVTIPQSVTLIDYGAFGGCSGLTSITVEEGNGVYHSSGNCLIETESKTLVVGCKNSVIPSDGSVTEIGESSFILLDGLTSITIPDGVTRIGDYAFFYCTNLTDIAIPDSVNDIGDSAFCYCWALKSVHIPEGVTLIGDYVFYECAALTELTLPSTVTSIGYAALYGCDSLQSLSLASPNDVLYSAGNCIIEKETKCVLAGCNASVIPSDGSVTGIWLTAFSGCRTVTHMVIPEGVTLIATDAFFGCEAMTRIDLPSTLTDISEYAFESCTALTEIHFAGTQAQWDAIEKQENWDFDCGEYTVSCGELAFALNEDGKGYTVTGLGTCTGTNIVIPSTYNGLPVTAIGEKALYKCDTVVSVTIPQSVTSIGERAFLQCSALTDVTICGGVTEIGYKAFYNCILLKNVTLPDTLLSIDDEAFRACYQLRQITLPNGLTRIGEEAFSLCTRLTEIVIPDSVTELGWSAFCYCESLSCAVIGNGVPYIDSYTFYECSALSDVTIGSNVTEIGYSAFEGCYALTSVRLPASLESIDPYAFYLCPLDIITVAEGNPVLHSSGNCVIDAETKTLILGCGSSKIPSDGSVTTIGYAAFAGTTMTKLDIPEGVETIESTAFFDCPNLKQVTLPNTLKRIEESAFLSCVALESVKLPSGLTTVTETAFTFCPELKELVIPVSVQMIELEAFSACSQLTTIRYEGTLAQWEALEKTIGWDWNTPEATVICTDGKCVKAENVFGNLDQKDAKVDDLTVDENGNYFYDGYAVYIPISAHNNHWMTGTSLQERIDGGGSYYDLTYWNDLLAAKDADGYTRLTTDSYSWLLTLISGADEDEVQIPCYLYILPGK